MKYNILSKIFDNYKHQEQKLAAKTLIELLENKERKTYRAMFDIEGGSVSSLWGQHHSLRVGESLLYIDDMVLKEKVTIIEKPEDIQPKILTPKDYLNTIKKYGLTSEFLVNTFKKNEIGFRSL